MKTKLTILFGVLLFIISCGTFDNPLDPTVDTDPSMYFKFYNDSISEDNEITNYNFGGYYIGAESMWFDLGVTNEKDTDVNLSIKFFSEPDSTELFSDFFNTSEEELSMQKEFTLDDAGNSIAVWAEISAIDGAENSVTERFEFTYDNIYPEIDENNSTYSNIFLKFNEKIRDFELFADEELIYSEYKIDKEEINFDLEVDVTKEYICKFRDRATNQSEETLLFGDLPIFEINEILPDPENNEIQTLPLNISVSCSNNLDEALSQNITCNEESIQITNKSVVDSVLSFTLISDDSSLETATINLTLKDEFDQTIEKTFDYEVNMALPELISNPNITVNEFNEEITLEFNEKISSCTIMTENSEIWYEGTEENSTTITFACNFEENDFHEELLNCSFTNLDGLSNNAELSVNYQSDILPELVTDPNFVVNTHNESILLEFSQEIENCSIVASDESVWYENSGINSDNITFDCSFEENDYHNETLTLTFSNSLGLENQVDINIDYVSDEFAIIDADSIENFSNEGTYTQEITFSHNLNIDECEVSYDGQPTQLSLINETTLKITKSFFMPSQGEKELVAHFVSETGEVIDHNWSVYQDIPTTLNESNITSSFQHDQLLITLPFNENIASDPLPIIIDNSLVPGEISNISIRRNTVKYNYSFETIPSEPTDIKFTVTVTDQLVNDFPEDHQDDASTTFDYVIHFEAK